MRRSVVFVLSWMSVVFTFIFGLAWLDNVYLSFIALIWRQTKEAAEKTSGILPIFDVLCVDHSTVATFIPFFSLIFVTLALVRIYRDMGKKNTFLLNEHFPFFPIYNEFVVTLGLIGTVWGLIMIGYFPNTEKIGIKELIYALHTALYSTLVALVWLYFFVHLVFKPGMRWMVKKSFRVENISETATDAIDQAKARFHGLNVELDQIIRKLAQLKENFSFKVIDEMKNILNENKVVEQQIKSNLDLVLKQMAPLAGLPNIEADLSSQLAESKKQTSFAKDMKDSMKTQDSNMAKVIILMQEQAAREQGSRVLTDRLQKAMKLFLNDKT